MRYNRFKQIVLLCIPLLFFGCVEEIVIESDSFESLLVIEAIITNEFKFQEVKLSRTYQLDVEGPSPLSGASILIQENGMTHNFEETSPGLYRSTTEFSASPNIDYQLFITTQNGGEYISDKKQLTPIREIDSLYAIRETNDDGVDGMAIYLDTTDPLGLTHYYYFTYEETFKIIAPYFTNMDTVYRESLDDAIPCNVYLIPRSPDKQICYATHYSNEINLASSADLIEARIERHLIRFISSSNYIMSHRYSLLAKQFVLSQQGYEYIETLNRFSSEGSIFSQVQAGFVGGNIRAVNNDLEKVIGLFEVASVDTKRVYFNYRDFYPTEPLPPYISDCNKSAPFRLNPDGSCGGLITVVTIGNYLYYEMNNGELIGGPFIMVPRVCGDCTAIGNTDPPEFWEE